ncbi:MAG TPA: hypothetical protein VGI39_17740 [Polyangiaceae bacterium]
MGIGRGEFSSCDAAPLSRLAERILLLIDARAWRALGLVERVVPERVREHLSTWPSGAEIEIRRCACGQALARKVVQREA